MKNKIIPFLWFDRQAEEAANYYVAIFERSKIINTNPNFVTFELDGQRFYGLNGGPEFKFNQAISLFVDCEDQAEVDKLWQALGQGGEEGECGWIKDKYGLWWQIIPKQLGILLGDHDKEKAGRVMQAMRQMKKISVADLEKAAQLT